MQGFEGCLGLRCSYLRHMRLQVMEVAIKDSFLIWVGEGEGRWAAFFPKSPRDPK